MENDRPERRRELSSKEQKALEKQRKKQREIDLKKARADAKYREEARKKARKEGKDGHVVVTIPAQYSEPKPKAKTPPKKRKKKTTPDIISAETDKRVRDLPPSDHSDGYYVNEVAVRKEQAAKQRKKKKVYQPKPMSPKRRRARRITAYVLIFTCVLIIGVILSFTVLFKTDKIEVEGNELYDDETIISLAGVAEGENIFVASITGDTESIVNNLPYVKEASVDFQIPGTVVINITHETPFYSLKSGKNYYLVSEEGRVLEKSSKRKKKKLMLVTAPKLKNIKVGSYIDVEESTVTNAMQEIAESLIDNGYDENITAINVKKISNITITYDDRIKIELGLPEDLDYKIRTAFTIINEKLDPNNTGTISGVLNVSECNSTQKSYFNEGSTKATTSVSPTEETTAATESTTQATTQYTTAYTTAYVDEYATEAGYYYYEQ